ncbi:MAG: hypothetical protein ABJZ55_13105 [Fuerstiella sp.]
MSDSLPQSIIEIMSPDQQIQRTRFKPKPAQSTPTSEDSQTVGRCRIARHPQMMLAIRLCSGEVEVLPYNSLARIRSDNSDQALRLSFTVGEVVIDGERLTRLFHYLCEHRVLEICQSDRAECLVDDTNVCVHSIQMKLADPV